jgi:transcriptional regulator of NAD metabolism
MSVQEIIADKLEKLLEKQKKEELNVFEKKELERCLLFAQNFKLPGFTGEPIVDDKEISDEAILNTLKRK